MNESSRISDLTWCLQALHDAADGLRRAINEIEQREILPTAAIRDLRKARENTLVELTRTSRLLEECRQEDAEAARESAEQDRVTLESVWGLR